MITLQEASPHARTETVHQIAGVLRHAEKDLANPTYELGLLGLSLFYCYYARYVQDDSYFDKATDYLEKGLATLDVGAYRRLYKADSLDSHLASIGRYMEFCKKHGFLDLDTNDYLSELDVTLAELMRSKISIGDFDLNSGALAAGFYFLSRYRSNPSVKPFLIELVCGLEEKAFQDENKNYYWRCPSLFNKVYFGISHGSALVVSFLAHVCEKGIETDAAKRVMRKATAYVLAHKRRQKLGFFPLFLGDKEEPKQFSQCYGDLGVGYALLRAGNTLTDQKIRTTGLSVLEDCLTRSKEDGQTWDASITYGASGLAAVFERLYHMTDDQRYQARAQYWYNIIPSYSTYQNEYAGYKSMLAIANGLWNTSFGWGVIGIGISLMRSEKPELPVLDDLLMIA